MNFKETRCYNRIKESNDDKIFPVPYYVKTDIEVTEENFSSIVDLEEIKYKMKLDSLPDFPSFNIREKVEERIKPFIGDFLLELKYAYFKSSNIDEGYKEIEKSEKFNNWLID